MKEYRGLVFAAVAAVVALVLGVGSTAYPWPIFGIALVIAVFVALANRPRVAFVMWLVSIAFIPYWVGLDILGYLPVPSLLGFVIAAVLIRKKQWVPSGWDYYLIALVAIAFLATVIDSSSRGSWFAMLTHWSLAFVIGRAVIPVVGKEFTVKAIAVVMSVVGGLALAEFLLVWHPFTGWIMDNPSFETWSPIQIRGGNDRSEWAFGHSIALGGSLTMAIPFVIQANFTTPRKVAMLALIGSGAVVSLSRGGLLAVGLTLALSLYALATVPAVQRFLIGSVVVGLGLWAFTGFSDLTAGSAVEASASSSYRSNMHDVLIPTMQMVGRSSAAIDTATGVRYGRFQSIDSTFLALGIGYGWLVAVLAIIAFLFLVVRVVLRHASAPEVALVGQLPVLTTVALITQYQILVWLMLGMSVTLYATSRRTNQTEGKNAQVDAMSV